MEKAKNRQTITATTTTIPTKTITKRLQSRAVMGQVRLQIMPATAMSMLTGNFGYLETPAMGL